jgi:hypothetical protein
MFKPHITTIFFSILIVSCSPEINSENQDKEDFINNDATEYSDSTSYASPTLYEAGNYSISFKKAESQGCNGLELMTPPTESEFIDKDSMVVRNGDRLIFTLESGDTTILQNKPYNEDEEDYLNTALYSFSGTVNGLNHWEVFAFGYECHYTVLVNKKSGNKTTVIGRPVASPDSKLVICGNPDLEAAYTINGFDILNYKNEELNKVGQLELLDWGPYEASWKNDSVAIIKKGEFDAEWNLIKSCVEMTIVKNGG